MSDVGDQSIKVTFNSMSITKKTVLDIIRLMAYRKQMDQFKVKHGYQKLKDLNKKNVELDGIGLDQADYKNIKKDLKKMGVDFAIHKRKDYNKIDLYFASRDVKQISNILKKYTEEKLDPKEKSIELKIKKSKEKAKKFNKNRQKSKSKIHAKQKEISR